MATDDFQRQVLEDLGELKANMKSLIGNGQPGRITNLEKTVTGHSRTINRLIGGLIVINFLLGTFIAFAMKYHK